MDSKIDDGGPAYPIANLDSPPSAWGMTLRDHFAVNADLSKDIEDDGCIDERTARNLMDGIAPPDWDDDFLNAQRWWAEAESRLRYIKADAMLKARRPA